MSGPSLPVRAASVRSKPSASMYGVLVCCLALAGSDGALADDLHHLRAHLLQVHAQASSTPAAMPSPSRTRPSSRCSVPM